MCSLIVVLSVLFACQSFLPASMQHFFGWGKQQPVESPPADLGDAIAELNQRAEAIDRKIALLDAELMKVRDRMRGMRDGPSKEIFRQKALRLLKMKRHDEQLRDQIHAQSFAMEQCHGAIQTMQNNQSTVAAMKKGLRAMKQEREKIDLKQVDVLSDEMNSLLEQNADVQDSLAHTHYLPEVSDEELESELATLGDELDIDLGLDDTDELDQLLGLSNSTQRRGMSKSVPKKEAGGEPGGASEDFGLPKVPDRPVIARKYPFF